ncbi:MAG: 1-acyl-sn-glycerol-3-phosphate acyltransferase [Actinomycetota bacterium]|jgi:1-acyl-sn-glycerol-3-phosphate acyltransferase|nr:1-acyl-sn-glycerol-3-phosphate acyltransferase [Actinomycetota bacterium]
MNVYRFLHFFVVGYTRLVYRVRVVGREHVPGAGAYIVAPSHRSMLDIPLAGAITTRRIRFMGKEPLFRVPVLGAIFRALGGFPVARDGSDVGPVRDSLKILQAGEPLVVYPEGTRQRGREIAPLQSGAAYLAAKAGVPIVPIGIAGAEETFRSRRGRLPGFGRIVVVVGEPILPPARAGSAVKRSAVDDLTATLHERLQKLIDEAYILRS